MASIILKITQVVTQEVVQRLQVHLSVDNSLIRLMGSNSLNFVLVSFRGRRLCLVVSSFGSLGPTKALTMINLTIIVTNIVDHELPCRG